MSGLEESDKEAAAVAVAPRVTLNDIKSSIKATHFINAFDVTKTVDESLKVLTICLVVHKNGFTIVGKSAPASPENYNKELGEKLAYEDCIRQLWPLMGFALRERLANE